MTLIPERLNQLDLITLDKGSHSNFNDGHCAMEVVSWLANEGFTDAPSCASPVLRRYTIALNDRWDTEQRQTLKPYLPRMVGTGGDGKDDARQQIATRFLCIDLLGPWLRLAGMDEQADSLAALTAATPAELREFLYRVRNEAWERRSASMERLRAKVRERLEERADADAVAVADADAVAVAVAAADAAADAVAAAAAAAVAVADAVADADADAVAVADAVADAVAAAVAAAAAVADADADAVAVADAVAPYWRRYEAAYEAARNYYREHPLPVFDKIRELGEQQRPLALTLLDQLIDPVPSPPGHTGGGR